MDSTRLRAFYRGFAMDTPQGNNAFSYAPRVNKVIHVPPLVKGTVDDVMPGDLVVFSEIVPGTGELNAPGLRQFVHIERPGQDIFICDNHNHAFSFWSAGIAAGAFPLGSTLVHVDQHKDTRPADVLPGEDHFHYANYILNVGNFIPPALGLGWFSQVVQVGSAEAFAVDPKDPFVLDIDLDIFAPVMGYIPDDLKITRLRTWIARSRFITLATSPFFMDQPSAAALVRRLL